MKPHLIKEERHNYSHVCPKWKGCFLGVGGIRNFSAEVYAEWVLRNSVHTSFYFTIPDSEPCPNRRPSEHTDTEVAFKNAPGGRYRFFLPKEKHRRALSKPKTIFFCNYQCNLGAKTLLGRRSPTFLRHLPTSRGANVAGSEVTCMCLRGSCVACM